MKRFTHLPFLLGAVLLLGACSTVNTRIQEKAPVFNSLDAASQDKIRHGDIDLGFTPDMVYMALGQPDARRDVVTPQGRSEQWIYRSYTDDYPDWGWGYAGYHRWLRPYGHYYRMYWEPVMIDDAMVEQDDIRVTFQNGRVVMIDQART